MGDLIYRDELLKFKENVYDEEGHLLYAVPTGIILRLSAVDAVPVRRGRWIDLGDATVVCSECANQILGEPDYDFCPCCGADMREVEKDG